jgi:acetamidase/formamidase
MATFQNARFISRVRGIELKEALILLTLVGRLNISRTAKWGAHNPVVCASFPKQAMERPAR